MQDWNDGLGETGLRYIWGIKVTEFADGLDMGGRERKEIDKDDSQASDFIVGGF